MNHNQKTSIRPINTSSSKFGVQFENNFIVLDDAKHIIGVDGSDASKLILENVENEFTVKFGGSKSSLNYITTLVYDKETGFLYTGDNHGHLHQYKVDTVSKTYEKVKDFGHLGIGRITSSHRFLHFVFFGVYNSKIKVLNLSTGELLPGQIETSVKFIRSFQVCVKSQDKIYLTVSGSGTDYSDDKTDLFDVSSWLLKYPVILRNYFSHHSFDQIKTFLEQKSTIKSQEKTIKKLSKKYQKYKAKFIEVQSKYNDLKNKHDQLQKHNKELTTVYKTLKIQSKIKRQEFYKKINILYQHKSKRTTIGNKMSLIGNGIFDEIDPLIIIRDLKEEIQEEKCKYTKLESSMYDVLAQKTTINEESEAKSDKINALQNKLAVISEVIGQR